MNNSQKVTIGVGKKFWHSELKWTKKIINHSSFPIRQIKSVSISVQEHSRTWNNRCLCWKGSEIPYISQPSAKAH